MSLTKKYKKYLLAVIAVICLSLIFVGIVHYRRNYLCYDVDFTIEDTLADGEGKSATVILLGGQSNASGCSRDDYLEKNVSEEKYSEYKNGYDNVYINYYCTGTNESKGFVKCAAKQGEAGGYFGPELGLAEKMHELYPDERFFIIKYAWGGLIFTTNGFLHPEKARQEICTRTLSALSSKVWNISFKRTMT